MSKKELGIQVEMGNDNPSEKSSKNSNINFGCIDNPWSVSVPEIINKLKVDPEKGLSQSEANNRKTLYGPNILVQERNISLFKVFKHEIVEPMILLLLFVGVFYSIPIWGELYDSITIFTIIGVLIFVEIYNEFKAKKNIASLKKLAAPLSPLLRDSKYVEVDTKDLVPGDIILLKIGQKLSADVRLIESYGIQVDESLLTGESTAVFKNHEEVLDPEIELVERRNMVFAGTTIIRGKGKGIVVATSINTELGKIAGITLEIKEPKTPLQKAMKQLALWLVWVALFFCILIPIIGIIQGRDIIVMILTGLSLSFATIPEELPIIITIVLALGAIKLSKRNALIKRLNAAETLGSVTVIATDKTGTLTENKMKVAKIYSDSKLEDLNLENLSNNQEEILKIGILVNNLNIKEDNGALQYIGDPMEIALVKAANNAKIPIKKIKNEYNLHYEFSFDNHRRMMSQIYSINNHFILYTKGAPENLLNKTSTLLIDDEEITMTEILKQDIMKIVNQLAIQGLRILGFAKRRLARVERNLDDVENNLNFIGLIGFIDPPRKEVSSAIKACQNAGIRIIMITGDYELTAKNIAENVGIEHKHVITGTQIEKMDENELKNVVMETSIFSRATPEHKLQIVNALKSNGEIVAVTGDGINDAPALKRADIGIAMGETGTDVARETADMVLIDDNFTTIEIAIEQGRKLYDNLKKGVRYYLAVKLALILIFLTPIIFNVPLPFAPIQIILLELFMDLAASTTFVIEPTESYAMKIKARSPNEKFINLKMRVDIIIGGISLGIAVLLIYLITYFQGFPQARSIAFATWMVGHIFLAINMRTNRDTLYQIGFFSNKMILLWAIGVFAVLFSIIYIPSLQFVFKLSPLNIFDWLYIFLVAFIFTFWIEFIKNIKRK